VKACHTCKGAEACKPEKLDGSKIRTSGAFGGKNLYCYTVCKRKLFCVFHLIVLFVKYYYSFFLLCRNLIQRQVYLSLVVLLDLVKQSIKISNAMPSIFYVAMKTCATIIRLVFVPNQNSSTVWNRLNYKYAHAVC